MRPKPRQLIAKAHRWGSFAFGVLLLIVVVSGVILLLAPEIEQVTHPRLYDSDDAPTRIAPGDALATVRSELPDFNLVGASVVANRGAWEVLDEKGHVARVDESSGQLLGMVDRDGGVMGFLANLHECALSCEGMAGYVPFLEKPAQIDGFDLTLGNEGTWGGLILAASGLVLLTLSISGLVIWWPGRRRLRRGLTVRRGVGRYKLNYDLHKVVGFVALPFLLMWAVTGVKFELPKQADAVWYALTPGDKPAEVEFASKPVKGEKVSLSQAIELAKAEVPSDSRLISVTTPDPGDKASFYELWFTHGTDPYRHSTWSGNLGVDVDRYSGRAVRYWPSERDPSVTSGLWQDWTGSLHMGFVVGWLPRVIWVAFGLAPLALAVTGTTTWLVRRRMRRRKAKATRTPQSA